jgi:chromosomal replication initiation ATPase DnaA
MDSFARLNLEEHRRASFDAVVVDVSRRTGISTFAIRGRDRYASVVRARHAVMTELWLNGWALIEIGRQFGRDHTTVRSAVMKTLGPEVYAEKMRSAAFQKCNVSAPVKIAGANTERAA